MSAILSAEDLQPVADLIDKLQNVQQALRDLHNAHDGDVPFNVVITQGTGVHERPVAHTHALSYWIVLQGLAAMERELLKQLQAREITVESVLPIAEAA